MKKIYIGLYGLYNHKMCFKEPLKIIKETEKCYFTKNSRFYKEEEERVRHLSTTQYPYLEVYFVSEENCDDKIKTAFAKWFEWQAEYIKGYMG